MISTPAYNLRPTAAGVAASSAPWSANGSWSSTCAGTVTMTATKSKFTATGAVRKHRNPIARRSQEGST